MSPTQQEFLDLTLINPDYLLQRIMDVLNNKIDYDNLSDNTISTMYVINESLEYIGTITVTSDHILIKRIKP